MAMPPVFGKKKSAFYKPISFQTILAFFIEKKGIRMEKMSVWKWGVCFILVIGLFLPFNQVFASISGKLIIFHAGSLTVPFERMEKEFEAKYPEVDILREPAGSTRCARKIVDLKKPCDIIASADYTIINRFLISKYADWNIRFASNQLVLCYTDKSRYAGQITEKNWYKILFTKDVVWGHSDPNIDPCGYRALMVLQLAEKYYKKPGLYQRCIDNCPKENIRGKSVELISLLQTGNMDYAFEYLSVAVQHKLKFIRFPNEINLGYPEYNNFYKQAKVKISGKKPGEFTQVQGKSITYGITLLKDAPNREAAISFLKYLLDPNGGLKILDEMGQPPFIPPVVADEKIKEKLPLHLQGLVKALR